jgi:methylthioribose-1-phosphate isomerase
VRVEDIEINKAMGRHGAALLPQGATVMTHCNAGALATGGYGTALGVIRAAVETGNPVAVLANETRPFLQGSRLTVWELQQDDIPVTLLTDNMAGHVMKAGKVGAVVVGADRIAGNGDVANKIGTYTSALAAKANGIPFYVAAPTTTIDPDCDHGDDIPIECRDHDEVRWTWGWSDEGRFMRVRTTPEGSKGHNPAFDVTPAELVAGIITEKGIVEASRAGLEPVARR